MKNLRENVFFMLVIGGLYAIVKEVISLIRETATMVKRASYMLNDIKRESPQKQVDKVKVDVDVHMKEDIKEPSRESVVEKKESSVRTEDVISDDNSTTLTKEEAFYYGGYEDDLQDKEEEKFNEDFEEEGKINKKDPVLKVHLPKNYEWSSEEEDDDSDVELDEDFYNNASYGDEDEEDEYQPGHPQHPGLSRPDENEPPVSSDLVWGAKGIQDGANTFRLKPKEEFPESDVWTPNDRQRDIPEDDDEYDEYDDDLENDDELEAFEDLDEREEGGYVNRYTGQIFENEEAVLRNFHAKKAEAKAAKQKEEIESMGKSVYRDWDSVNKRTATEEGLSRAFLGDPNYK